MRTLVISDLHLGNRAGHDVLRGRVPLDCLLESLDDVDRLVLHGDLVELMTRNPRRPLTAAEPVVRALGQRLGREREAVLVPGNHDATLVRSWARAQGAKLTIDSPVPLDATRALARVVSWLAPARVSVRYPGVWLQERIWATHGHYLDTHLVPESAFGVLRGGLGRDSRQTARPIDYERSRGGARTSGGSFVARVIQRPVPTLLDSGARAVRSAALPAVPRLLKSARLAPVTASLVDLQMQRAGIPALGRVAKRLGVEADWVLFGHVHRAGPLPDDSLALWAGDGGSPRYLNTGSWLYEPLLVDRSSPPHPYWPGSALLIEPGHDPRVIGLLDGLSAPDLTDRR